jgi:RecA/RadA recombinase
MAKKPKSTGSSGSNLIERMIGASSTDNNKILTESEFFNDKDMTQTRVPAINIALSAAVDGGVTSGLTLFAGPSKHFKSNMSLLLVVAYMRKYPDAVCLFFDNEFGTTPDYFKTQGVPINRVIHCPFMNIEELKFEMIKKLEAIERGDRVIIFVDSIGNAASKKEIEDAKEEKSAADMTRAKQIKSLTRMITPYLTVKDIPCVMVAHTYDTQEMFSKKVVSGGTGLTYSADTIIIIGRQQEKEGKELVGWNFILNIEKSRFVKEQSKIPLNVTFDGGINTYSGLLDIALEIGFVTQPSQGYFQRSFLNKDTGEMVIPNGEKKWRRAETDCVEFWKPMFNHVAFKEAVITHYKVASVDVSDEVYAEVDDLFSGGDDFQFDMDIPEDIEQDEIEIDQLSDDIPVLPV